MESEVGWNDREVLGVATVDMNHPRDLVNLVRVDVGRQTIDASAWLAAVSPWHRAACAAIARHWAGILALEVYAESEKDPREWIDRIRGAAARLSPPAAGLRHARGVVEWRHPESRPEDPPSTGICWVGDASGGLGGFYLCWTHLWNLECLGGCHWARDLCEFTPLGGAAEDVVAHVAYRLALEGESSSWRWRR